jgi:F-type H+-transporting ATPase subunit a
MMFIAEAPPVSIVAEKLFNIGPLAVTNSMVLGVLGTALTFWILLYTRNRIQTRRYNRFSVAVLWLYEYLQETVEQVMGSRELARKVGPLAITLFFVLVVNNELDVLPIVGTVTYHGVPLFRGLAADLNFTAAIAVITMVTAQIYGVKTHGFFGNLGRYVGNPFTQPMHVFEGFLELIAEFSRLIGLAMRLFGNIFGGEVLIAIMGYITSYFSVVSLPPFIILELFVGLVQAYVFFMLTAVFISLGTIRHSEHDPNPEDIINNPGGVHVETSN